MVNQGPRTNPDEYIPLSKAPSASVSSKPAETSQPAQPKPRPPIVDKLGSTEPATIAAKATKSGVIKVNQNCDLKSLFCD